MADWIEAAGRGWVGRRLISCALSLSLSLISSSIFFGWFISIIFYFCVWVWVKMEEEGS